MRRTAYSQADSLRPLLCNPRPASVRAALAFAAAVLAILGGCSAPEEVEFTPLKGERAESQWEMHLLDSGNDTPLTGAMAASVANPGEGRLYVMLPMGQTLGKCVLSGGRASCEPTVPQTAPLLRRAADPMAKMLEAAAERGDAGMFGLGASLPRSLQGRGWRCDAEGDWLVYREDRAKWTLRLKRIK